MQRLRTARQLIRWMLAGFLLALGVAVAAPVFNPQAAELVCAGTGGMKLVTLESDGLPDASAGHTLDCSLCVQGALLAAWPRRSASPVPPRVHERVAATGVAQARRSAAPLAARGPPVRS